MKRNQILRGISIICAVALIAAGALWLKSVLGFSFANAEKYSAGGAEITGTVRNLDISWTSGSVTLEYDQGGTVRIREEADKALSPDQRMHWMLDGDTLRIRWEKPGLRLFSLSAPKKSLTVTLPEGAALDTVKIDATSGALVIPALRADSVTLNVTSGEIDASVDARKVAASLTSGSLKVHAGGKTEEVAASATSGTMTVEAENAGRVRLHSTSGEIRAAVKSAREITASATSGGIHALIGHAQKADLGSTSGTVYVKTAGTDTLKVGTTSGSVTLCLPPEPGFTARLDTVSGRISYELPLTKQGGSYLCGDGSADVKIGTTSGDISILAFSE